MVYLKKNETPSVYSILGKWSAEILLLLFASIMLVTIWVLLNIYNQQREPSWRYHINLNTIVAILSTFLRASLLSIVEEGLETP